MRRLKLFCFPYAGGSAVIYSKWRRYLDPGIELRAVELAGRGKRIHEGLYRNVADAVSDIMDLIKNEIKDTPYALFGHSMGSMIAYELARKISTDGFPPPRHVFFSGRGAPHLRKEKEQLYHLMEDEEFRTAVLELGGTSPEFFHHPELLELFLPMLRNDFRLAEERDRADDISLLDVNITVLTGKDDDLTVEQIQAWKQYTTRFCNIHYFEGGHFFINDDITGVVEIINDTLTNDPS